MKPAISIVIGTYNMADKLSLVLESFSQQTFNSEQIEVVVVDSGSSDHTKDVIEKAYPYTLNFVQQPNKGKSAARNTGIKLAKSDTILITDADMIAHPDFVAEHVRLQRQYNNKVMIEGKTWVLTREQIPPDKNLKRPYIVHSVKDLQPLDFYYCLTGNLSIPKYLFDQYGLFDDTFTGYGWEDIEFGYRLIRVNKRPLIYADKAVNYHYHVWNQTEELQRRYKMGKSVSQLLSIYPKLKVFLGIHPLNKGLYRVMSRAPAMVRHQEEKMNSGSISMLWKQLLREYHFMRGFYDEIKKTDASIA